MKFDFFSSHFSVFYSSDLLCGGTVIEHAHDVGLFHDDQLFALELDLGARPFAEQHAVARFDVHRLELAIIAPRTWTGGDHLALHRLFFRRVGDDDAARRLLLALDAPNQNAVVQWTEFHEYLLERKPNGISTLTLRVLLT